MTEADLTDTLAYTCAGHELVDRGLNIVRDQQGEEGCKGAIEGVKLRDGIKNAAMLIGGFSTVITLQIYNLSTSYH